MKPQRTPLTVVATDSRTPRRRRQARSTRSSVRSTRSACTPTSRRSNGTTRAPTSRAGSLLARRALGACERSRWSAAATLTSRWSTTSGISWIASELIDERRGPSAKSARRRGNLCVWRISCTRITTLRCVVYAAAAAARTCLSPRLAIAVGACARVGLRKYVFRASPRRDNDRDESDVIASHVQRRTFRSGADGHRRGVETT